MPESTFEVKTVGVDYLCDRCSTPMVRDGNFVYACHPPLYPHACPSCGQKMNLKDTYPTFRTQRVEKSS